MPQAGFGQVTVRAQIQAMTVAVAAVGERRLRVEVADPLLGLVAHPLRRTRGRRRRGPRRPSHVPDLRVGEPGEDRRLVPELRRDLDQCLVDEHGDRVEVGRVRLQAESLGLQRDRAAAGERVEDRRRVAVGRLEDLGVRFGEELSSRMFSQTTSRSMRSWSRSRSARCSSSVGNSSGCARRVVDELGEQHRAAAASGRRAHHRCSVDGWPCRIDFSRADSRLIASSGSATSISLRFCTTSSTLRALGPGLELTGGMRRRDSACPNLVGGPDGIGTNRERGCAAPHPRTVSPGCARCVHRCHRDG